VPAIKPPWFKLTAYDMNQGTIRWQVPVGEVQHLAERGIRGTGTAYWIRGGPAITAGGLIFLATGDSFRAYDRDTGAELWSAPLPGLGEGIPSVYQVDGRQYVVVSLTRGGQGAPPVSTTRTPGYVAFALPTGSAGR
jgi:quinoprotein glucose dehydrogenase